MKNHCPALGNYYEAFGKDGTSIFPSLSVERECASNWQHSQIGLYIPAYI